MDLLGHRSSASETGVGQQHDELVTTEAEHQVRLTARIAQHFGDMLEHGVATLMAEVVVVALEEVEIDHQHREAGALVNQSLDVLGHRTVIPETGQRIGLRAQLDGTMDGGVAQRDRDVPGEQLDEIELGITKASVGAQTLDGQHALDTLAAAQRGDDQRSRLRPNRCEMSHPLVGHLVLDELCRACPQDMTADALLVTERCGEEFGGVDAAGEDRPQHVRLGVVDVDTYVVDAE